MSNYPITDRNRVVRNAKRAHYDEETVHAILDDGFICQVGFEQNGQTLIIPIAYGRVGQTLYLHGAVGNQLLNALNNSRSACISVTHLDGLVLARSLFHHSVNYRSVVLFGQGRLVETDEEKLLGLKALTDQMLPGRWEESRQPNPTELKSTKVIAFVIEQASAKVRSGPPKDDPEDEDAAVWAGVVPLSKKWLAPIRDEISGTDLDMPDSVRALF